MPTDLFPETLEWVAPDSRDEVLESVRDKARRIRIRRRLPLVAGGLTALAIVAATTLPTPGDPARVRTAGNGDDSYLVDEERTVEEGDTSATGRARVSGDGQSAEASAQARSGDTQPVGGKVAVGPRDSSSSPPLASHPLLSDPAGDDYSSVGARDRGAQHQDAIDLRSADFVLNGDILTFVSDVQDLGSFGVGHPDDTYSARFGFVTADDTYIEVRLDLDSELRVVDTSGGYLTPSNTMTPAEKSFAVSGSADRDGDRVIITARLADVNDALAARNRSSLGAGSRVRNLFASNTMTMKTTDSAAVAVHDSRSDIAQDPDNRPWVMGD